MVIVKDFNFLVDRTLPIPPQTFQTRSPLFDSKTLELFEHIYSYPSKFKLRWNAIDEFQQDLFLSSNYGVFEHSFPFVDFIEDWFFYEKEQCIKSNSYSLTEFIDGYRDKRNSSAFYRTKTKKIQQALSKIPIYVVLNGHNEIVLSQNSNSLSLKNTLPSLKQVIYDVSGAFDPEIEQRQQLGFFFTTRKDAEIYLQEIAKADIDGTKKVGLAIHSIGLNSAYKITREHHPSVDFRYVPNFSEVKELVNHTISKPEFIVEDTQQQLRFRRRNQNLFPVLEQIGTWISPSISFLHNQEYFKGVPIYIVQLRDTPQNKAVVQYFKVINWVDTGWGKLIQFLDNSIGFGHNWIMQGSLYEAGCSENFSNYVFFEKEAALSFIKNKGRRVARFAGSRTSNIEPAVRKPKIYIYNLEDFLELWEEKLQSDLYPDNSQYRKNILEASNTVFIQPTYSLIGIEDWQAKIKPNPLRQVKQTLSVKYRVFKSFVGLFLGVGYN